jgi:uncharacterized protein (TIGR00255 family)
MTGYGRARGALSSRWAAELSARSVNHRFLDLSLRLREAEAPLEAGMRRAFARHLARGKVDVTLRLSRVDAGGPEIVIDERLLASLLSRLADLSRRFPIKGELEARDLVVIPQLLSLDSSSEGFTPEELAACESLAEEAARALVAMREEEGRRIAAELTERVAALVAQLQPIAARRDEIVQSIAATLKERLRSLFPDVPLDPGRLEQEAALLAERSDVSEELARLTGHLEQFRELLAKPAGPIGKKLDFLSQEILREINTLGSKARDRQLSREVVAMKAETEKIREQVQNVE